MIDDTMIKRLAVQSRLHNFLIEMGCINQFYPIEQLQSFARTCYTAGQGDAHYAAGQASQKDIEIDLLSNALHDALDALEAGEGGDWQSARRALCIALSPNAKVDALPDHTPVEPEEIYSPNTVVLEG